MRHMKIRLLSSTVIPAVVGAGMALGTMTSMTTQSVATEVSGGTLPTAKSRDREIQLAAGNPCNPCAAKKSCNPCNPCAAKKSANPCNPCAAKKACNPCNPCAAKKAVSPCNPCAANPCNPCAAAKTATYSSKCVVPRLVAGWATNPCNPCNPCAAKKAANPCNPCAANPCNPCGASASAPELTAAEARAVYSCLKPEMVKAYRKAGVTEVMGYEAWLNVASSPYVAATHGGRYVNNYVDAHGDYRYKKYENAGVMPQGTTLAKDSFVVHASGKVSVGPLFVMEKMNKGWRKSTGDWRYSMLMPNGTVAGRTGMKGMSMQFCADCHASVAPDQDYIMLLPEENRVKF